ncbi:MAG TPA: LysR substrate-binding domain-containing protein, partial [Rhodopila sp.]|uniref:LysR substrate-binding domain-containing protein n=1 Tax=Rhodopila sp. TaxID=2480087 RepID=UPI002BE33F36
MQRLPLGPMEAFVAVARSGSLARAAVAMNLTVPALSRRVRLLEAHLGVRLFRRLPRGLGLTEAGQAYFAILGPAWDRMQAATEAVRDQGRRRTIRVTTMPTFAANWLMPRLVRFPSGRSGVEVELHTSADLEDLHARPDLDCAIRLGRGPWPGLTCEPLLPVHAFPVASPAFADTLGPSRTPADLSRQPLIETHHQPAFWREWFAAAQPAAGTGPDAAPRGRHRFDNLQLVYEAAAAGMGIALGLDPAVRPYLDSGRLKRLLPDSVRLPRDFHLVRRRDGPADDRCFRLFRDWLHA